MTTELIMLALSVVLGFLHVLASGHATTRQYGVAWNMGARDAAMSALNPLAGRLERASRNFQETFPFFLAAVVLAHLAGRHGVLTVWGSVIYLVGRVVYLPVYALGIPYLRSIVWGVATAGVVMLLIALL